MLNAESAKSILEKAKSNPQWWVQNVLGSKLWHKQIEVLESIRDNQEIAVASCHGAGKSYVAACAALWYVCCHRPAIVITTAPTDRQVKGILWKEIRLAHQKAKVPIGGKLLSQELKFDSNHWIWGFTAPEYDPDRFQGFHEVNVLVIVDEAVGVSEQIYQAIEGILTSENAKLLMISNPTDASGRFGQSFKTAGIKKIGISAFDTPNFTDFNITEEDIEQDIWQEKITGQLPMPYLITPNWVSQRYKRWGRESPLYHSRVKGQFPQQGTDSLIPLAWVQAAMERSLDPGEPVELGIDVARYGPDETVFLLRQGPVARMKKVIPMGDTMETTGQTIKMMAETGAVVAKIDADGLGAGVYDRMQEQGKPTLEMRSGMKASDSERFANTRAEWWWGLRERFEEGDIDIEEDEELISQLSSMKYKVNSRGQIQVEGKDEMKKRGLPSPDRADALMLVFAKDTKGPLKIRAKSVRR